MNAKLNTTDGHQITIDIPKQQAFPSFIAHVGNLYQCQNVVEVVGVYDSVGEVFVVDTETQPECENNSSCCSGSCQ